MKKTLVVVALGLVALASAAGAQTTAGTEPESALAAAQTISAQDAAERDRIRHTRATERANFDAEEAQCYRLFAVNNCLIAVRKRSRELFADLRRQEISLNDAQRRRRAAEQLLRSDENVLRSR